MVFLVPCITVPACQRMGAIRSECICINPFALIQYSLCPHFGQLKPSCAIHIDQVVSASLFGTKTFVKFDLAAGEVFVG